MDAAFDKAFFVLKNRVEELMNHISNLSRPFKFQFQNSLFPPL